jgi:type I protein arginine methyltransferase
MARRGRYQVSSLQKSVQAGSAEPSFQGDALWSGLNNEISIEDPYFYSYSHYGIHEEMIKDKVRTESYMNAMIQNPQLFADKVVLDIGCGTGILSIFAARAGARHVYGIDAADIAIQASQIVQDNGLSDKITIIRGKAEEITLPVASVDIIVSEWMGYFLLYESMLDTVLYARDKWLAPDGLMFPDHAKMYVSGIEDADYKERKLDFWYDVYGIDMSIIRPTVISEPIVDVVEAPAVITTECLLYDIDLKKVRICDLEFAARYRITATKTDYLHALIAYFEVEFNHGHKQIKLSTNPAKKYTHWKQTVFYFEGEIPMMCGEEVWGSIAIRKNPDHKRDVDIKISYHFDGTKTRFNETRFYKLR